MRGASAALCGRPGSPRVASPHPFGPSREDMTAQGHPRTRFQRAIEGRWLFHAELAAREMGTLTLDEALDLVVLYAEVEPAKFDRAAGRWLGATSTRVRACRC